jgi:hypothetical protein
MSPGMLVPSVGREQLALKPPLKLWTLAEKVKLWISSVSASWSYVGTMKRDENGRKWKNPFEDHRVVTLG